MEFSRAGLDIGPREQVDWASFRGSNLKGSI